jgi:hypothetical protein
MARDEFKNLGFVEEGKRNWNKPQEAPESQTSTAR